MAKTIRFPKRIGKVATHPQFRHIHYPPAGYQILTDDRPTLVTLRDLKRIGARLTDIIGQLRGTVSPWTLARFLRTRRLLPFGTGEPIFVPTFPVVIGTEPWFIEIEDLLTLFDPFVTSGKTATIDIGLQDIFPIVRWLLEDRACLGIVTHIQETRAGLERLFASPDISSKTYFMRVPYVPGGPVTTPPAVAERQSGEPLRLFFNNSWHQIPSNFFVRGGLFVLNACERLVRDGVPFHLTIRSRLPREIIARYRGLLASSAVTVVDGYLDWPSYSSLMGLCHVYLLPSARIHVYSLLEALYHGLTVVTSDGWGIGNYITHEVNGLVVPGLYGVASWQGENGQLSEDYEQMRRDNRKFEDGLYAALRGLVDDDERRRHLGTAGQTFVHHELSIAAFNTEFGAFLERVL